MNRKRARPFKPTLELLEDRCVPTAGFLDPTFNTTGVVTTQVGQVGTEYAHAAAVYPSGTTNAGKIVVVGGVTGSRSNGNLDFALVRYNADGSLDPTFGKGGMASTSLVSSEDQAMAVALVGDKVLAGGYALVNTHTNLDDFALARFNADGTLDQTFGTKGKVTTDFGGSDDIAMAMAVQGDGKVLLAGITNAGTGSSSYTVFAVVRYNANGTLDTTFGNGGKVTVNVGEGLEPGFTDKYMDMVLSGNQIVLAGWARSSDMYVVRLTSTGQLDSTFGTGGMVKLGQGYNTRLAVQSDGNLVVAYTSNDNLRPDPGIFVTRLLANGVTDTTFGTAGTARLPWSVTGWGANASAVAVDPLGRTEIGGWQDNNGSSSNGKLVIARFTPSGALDPTFGVGGYNTSGNALNLYTYLNAFPALVLQPDGKTLLVGTAGNQTEFAVVRFLGDSPTIGSFTASSNSVTAGTNLTLTASTIVDLTAGATITQVAFYYFDSTGNKVTLGTVTVSSAGSWTLNSATAFGLPAGTYTIYAQAEDSYGIFGDPFALTLTVQ
jgi:uncharacterized delta-60 repeat protein